MGLRSVVVLSFLIALTLALPLAQAQLGLGGLLGPILGLLRIQGVLYCTPNGSIGVNGTATPVFPSKLTSL